MNAAIPSGLDFPALSDPRYPVHRMADLLRPYLREIVVRFRPERIILFGSYAYGVPTQHSDFDLLVIRPDISSARESNLQLRYAVWEMSAPPISFTFLSNTPEEVEQKLREGSPIFREIMRKGLEVYAAQANQ